MCRRAVHGVPVTSHHPPHRKREEKAVALLPPFLLYIFPTFYLLVKRLHFLAIVIGQDQGSAVRDLMC